jgi:hypothetical protein
MDSFLIQAILIAGVGGEGNSFWMQILVFLLLAVIWGVYNLVKNKRNEFKDQEQSRTEETSLRNAKRPWRFQLPQEPVLGFDGPDTVGQEKLEKKLVEKKSKDLQSGMELLESGFLLSIVENTEDGDQNDLTMRKLNFNELLRRRKLDQVNSKALKVYAINRRNLYGKDIQCEAMRELAERTAYTSKYNQPQPALSLSL